MKSYIFYILFILPTLVNAATNVVDGVNIDKFGVFGDREGFICAVFKRKEDKYNLCTSSNDKSFDATQSILRAYALSGNILRISYDTNIYYLLNNEKWYKILNLSPCYSPNGCY